MPNCLAGYQTCGLSSRGGAEHARQIQPHVAARCYAMVKTVELRPSGGRYVAGSKGLIRRKSANEKISRVARLQVYWTVQPRIGKSETCRGAFFRDER